MVGPLVLASGSPRRRELLRRWGIPFEVVVPQGVQEHLDPAGSAGEQALANARRKAQAVAGGGCDHRLVLGADTVVAVDGRVLGKADTPATAACMLRSLSGRTHEVHTAVVVIQAREARTREQVASARVTFRELAQKEVDAYVASGEWRGRAGAYSVQDGAAAFVAGLEGELETVIGLPRTVTLSLLASGCGGSRP
jgi:septum formation protein